MGTGIYLSVLILLATHTAQSYNILAVYPTPTVSHQQSCQGVTKALAKQGHNVTVITSLPNKISIPNHNEIDVGFLFQEFEEYQKQHKFSLQTRVTPRKLLPLLAGTFANSMDALLQSKQVQELLKSNMKFDLIIYEGLYPSALGLVHHFNYPPSIVMFTVPLYGPVHSSMGNPIFPSYIPSFTAPHSDRMSFFERLVNLVYILYELYVHEFYMYPYHDGIVRKYFGDIPSVREMEKNNSLMLLSGDLSQSYPMPLQPNTVQIGTLHVSPDHKPLQNELKAWMDNSIDGVIYFSLGSNMNGTSLSKVKREAFADVFGLFPTYRVIWKWESDSEFSGKPSNVLLRKWLPQQAVLAHPKTKLFISHCGHQSRQESIHYGVPILGVPLFWDQDWNCEKLVTNHAGLVIDFNNITPDIVYEKIKAILFDKRFKQNMEKLSGISKDKPMSGADTAVWWIEYVIRKNGAAHLKPAVQDLYWFQYLLLDVLTFLFITISLTAYIVYALIRKLWNHRSINKKVKSS